MKTRLDCVAMKHRGAEKVQAKISGLTIAEELAFWQMRSIALKKQKEEVLKKSDLSEVNV